jgi:hypothetical protein
MVARVNTQIVEQFGMLSVAVDVDSREVHRQISTSMALAGNVW